MLCEEGDNGERSFQETEDQQLLPEHLSEWPQSGSKSSVDGAATGGSPVAPLDERRPDRVELSDHARLFDNRVHCDCNKVKTIREIDSTCCVRDARTNGGDRRVAR